MKAALQKRTWKDEALTRHVKQAFRLRFGINCNHAMREHIKQMIAAGRTEVVERQTCARARHRLVLDGQVVDVIYDNRRHKLVTALYPGALPKYLLVAYVEGQRLEVGRFSSCKLAVNIARNLFGADVECEVLREEGT